jgi:hypothetical protein
MLLITKDVIWRGPGSGGGWHPAILKHSLACAVGVILPGWYCRRTGREIASIASQTENKEETNNNYTAAMIGTTDNSSV